MSVSFNHIISEQTLDGIPGIRRISLKIVEGYESIDGYELELSDQLTSRDYLSKKIGKKGIRQLIFSRLTGKLLDSIFRTNEYNRTNYNNHEICEGVCSLVLRNCEVISDLHVIAMRTLYPNLRSLTIINNKILDNTIVEIALRFNEQILALYLEGCPFVTNGIYEALGDHCKNLKGFLPVGSKGADDINFAQLRGVISHYEQHGNLKTKNYLGEYYQSEGVLKSTANESEKKVDAKKAFDQFMESAKGGVREAQYNLAVHYENGVYCEKDDQQAKYWYRLAAQQGEPRSLKKMGDFYRDGFTDFDGTVILKDEERAFRFYLEANAYEDQLVKTRLKVTQLPEKQNESTVNHPVVWNHSMLNSIANQYANGSSEYVKNLKKAFKWHQRAAELKLQDSEGNSDSQCWLGQCYQGDYHFDKHSGAGIEQDECKAVSWFFKSANQNNPQGLFSLGLCYEKGIRSEQGLESPIDKYRQAAAKGHSEAMYRLGLCFENQIMLKGVSRDMVAAFNWHKSAGDKGHADALYRSGLCYELGVGTAQNLEKAYQCYKKAAMMDHAESKYQLGRCIVEGSGTTVNEIDAFYYFLSAAKQGCPQAIWHVIWCYMNSYGLQENGFKDDAERWYNQSLLKRQVKIRSSKADMINEYMEWSRQNEAKKWFDLLASQAKRGTPVAQFYIGLCYQTGLAVQIDVSKAFRYYLRASELNCREAQFSVAACYAHGIGTLKNSEKAFWFYRNKANSGDVEAQYIVGLCYQFGIGVSLDEEKAFEWYKKAADQGCLDAQYRLHMHAGGLVEKKSETIEAERNRKQGIWYLQDDGFGKDYSEALKYLQEAVKHGSIDALYWIGVCLLKGKGNDPNKALGYFEKAAQEDHCEAQYQLGRCFELGIGTKPDKKKAFEWFRKAAILGQPDAQFKMAVGYYSGCDGVLRREIEAMILFKKCADRGNVQAQSFLRETIDKYQSVVFQKLENLFQEVSKGEKEDDYRLACFLLRKGDAHDAEEAMIWLAKAAEKGHQEAKYDIEEMRSRYPDETEFWVEKGDHIVDRIIRIASEPNTLSQMKEFVDDPKKKTWKTIAELKDWSFRTIREWIIPVPIIGRRVAGYLKTDLKKK